MDKEIYALSIETDDVQLVTRGNHSNITMIVGKEQIRSIVDTSLFAVVEYLQERGFKVELPPCKKCGDDATHTRKRK